MSLERGVKGHLKTRENRRLLAFLGQSVHGDMQNKLTKELGDTPGKHAELHVVRSLPFTLFIWIFFFKKVMYFTLLYLPGRIHDPEQKHLGN